MIKNTAHKIERLARLVEQDLLDLKRDVQTGGAGVAERLTTSIGRASMIQAAANEIGHTLRDLAG